jgi:hypothetical protein
VTTPEMSAAPDRKVIACNLTEGIAEASKGALAYVVLPNNGNGHDRIVILLRSRGGRWIRKWESIKRLSNFRVKTIPVGHPRYWSDPLSPQALWDYEPESYVGRFQAAHERSSQKASATSREGDGS